MIKNNYKASPPLRACPSSPLLALFQPPFLPSQKRSARLVAPFQPPSSLRSQRFHRWSPPPRRSGVFANHLHLMVMVGTKCEESARVVILFSCCCLWFFPITRPAVHELVRKVTMAEQIATMRYLMNAFIFGFIRFSCPLLTFRLLFKRRKRRTRIRAWSRD